MIYISKFIDIAKVPAKKTPISIVKKPPPWYTEKKLTEYRPLAPKNKDVGAYMDKLSALNSVEIVNKISYLAHNKDPILVCYENWQCEAVKEWLTDNGFDCELYSREDTKWK